MNTTHTYIYAGYLPVAHCSETVMTFAHGMLYVFQIMVPWMMAHWEEYHTGIMVYGNGWFGILEANYALVIIHLITAVYGPGLWVQHIPLPANIMQALPAALQPAAADLSKSFTWRWNHRLRCVHEPPVIHRHVYRKPFVS